MHRLMDCGEGRDLELNSCEVRHDTVHRPSTGSPGVAALSLLYILASPETSGGSIFVAHMVLFMITYYRSLSDIDYADFMRRARCKVYQSSTGLTNLGTTVTF
jgi:hypothetical protein